MHTCDLQGNWRHAINNRPVSREELMMVLAHLVGLRINGLYFTQTQRLSLGEVGLEETTQDGTGGPGNTVEQCSCPSQYSGDSCEVGIISPCIKKLLECNSYRFTKVATKDKCTSKTRNVDHVISTDTELGGERC